MKRLLRRVLPGLFGALLVAGLLALGQWQAGRALEKDARQRQWDALAAQPPLLARADGPAPLPGRVIRLEGSWQPEGLVLLDNRTHGGRAGYHVWMPLRLSDGSGSVLVARGWLAAGPRRDQLPMVTTPTGQVRVTASAQPDATPPAWLRWMGGGATGSTDDDSRGRVWQQMDAAAYQAATGLRVAPWRVHQLSPADDGLVRDWPRADAGAERHRAYALQWRALAAGAAAWMLLVWARARRARRASPPADSQALPQEPEHVPCRSA